VLRYKREDLCRQILIDICFERPAETRLLSTELKPSNFPVALESGCSLPRRPSIEATPDAGVVPPTAVAVGEIAGPGGNVQ
jgi:hypothetical protein